MKWKKIRKREMKPKGEEKIYTRRLKPDCSHCTYTVCKGGKKLLSVKPGTLRILWGVIPSVDKTTHRT